MALYAFDGTWNKAKTGDDEEYDNTNVARFFNAYALPAVGGNRYIQGVGTRLKSLGKVLGGAFGLGNRGRVSKAYEHLCSQWELGDTTIDIVGFSRGAAMTLDFCHMIQERGIRKPDSKAVVEPSPPIRFLGVWDTVAAFGLANLGLADLNFGHHLKLPRENVRYAFHALALDERRPAFLPTRLKGAYEVWFRGVHSDVGGGNSNRGLNDISMRWMLSKAVAAGLPIAADAIGALEPKPDTSPELKKIPVSLRLVTQVDRYHHTVSPMPGCKMPPDTCEVETAEKEDTALEVGMDGLEVLGPEFRLRFEVLVADARSEVQRLAFPIDGVREALLTLIETRIPLVTDEAKLQQARVSIVRLMRAVVENAHRRQFYALNDFFLTEALFRLRPLFPFTDD